VELDVELERKGFSLICSDKLGVVESKNAKIDNCSLEKRGHSLETNLFYDFVKF
jgi:hypothetical protein